MNPLKLGVGVILVVIGALLLADGVIGWVNNTYVFIADVNPTFKFIVGLIAIMSATRMLQESKEWTILLESVFVFDSWSKTSFTRYIPANSRYTENFFS